MEIYYRQGRNRPQTAGYIGINKATAYVNADANRVLKISRNNRLVFGKRYNTLMFGITDKNHKNPCWMPSLAGVTVSCGLAPQVLKRFTTGKYSYAPSHKENGITWYKLAKIK